MTNAERFAPTPEQAEMHAIWRAEVQYLDDDWKGAVIAYRVPEHYAPKVRRAMDFMGAHVDRVVEKETRGRTYVTLYSSGVRWYDHHPEAIPDRSA